MDIKALIDEVAKKHHIILTEEDPIFITVTLNEMILNHFITEINNQLNTAQDQISASTLQQMDLAKAIASKIVTQTSSYVTDNIKCTLEESQYRINAQMNSQLQESISIYEKIEKTKRHVFITAAIIGMCSTLVIGIILSRVFS